MVTVLFEIEKGEGQATYGPYDAGQLLINELWPIQDGEPLKALAEYDTYEGTWHVFGRDKTRFTLVTIQAVA